MKDSRHTYRRATAAMFLIPAAVSICLLTVTADAVDNSWQAGNGKWENSNNWSRVLAPSTSDTVDVITNAGNNTVTVDATTAGSFPTTMSINNLLVGNNRMQLTTAIATAFHVLNTFTLTGGGSLVVTDTTVWIEGSGGLTIGPAINTTGTAWMADGQLIVTNFTANVPSPVFVGKGGVGQLIVSNGAAQAYQLNVAYSAGSQGTLTVAGGTVKALGFGMNVAGFSGSASAATGTVWVTGGQLVTTNGPTSLGYNGGRAYVIVSNGTWLASDVDIGNAFGGAGTLTVAGGTVSTRGAMFIGYSVSGNGGTVWVTDGQLLATNTASRIYVGEGGVGRLTVSNGTLIANSLIVATNTASHGIFTVVGGTVTIGGQTVTNGFSLGSTAGTTGDVAITGGQLIVTNTSVLIGSGGVGHMTIGTTNGGASVAGLKIGIEAGSGGSILRTKSMRVSVSPGSSGTLTLLSGGTNETDTSLIIGDCSLAVTGTVEITDGSLFVTNASGTAFLEVSSGSLIINSGTLVADILVMTNRCGLFVRNGGTFNISSNNLAPSLDADGDGIANGYEQGHGLDPLNAADASVDSDGDGLTNLQEFQAGTDATNSASAFRITSVLREGSGLRITWSTAAGKTNALDRSASSGSYTTNFVTIFTVTNTVGTVTNYLDTGAATNFPSRYYRVRLLP